MNEVTQLLDAVGRGESKAAERLLPLVYDELRQLAAQRLAQETPGQTLQATALVHEAYLRLVGQDQEQEWDSRAHFFAAAAEAMRRILVDAARRKRRLKRGGDGQRVGLEAVEPQAKSPFDDVLAVHEALQALAQEDAKKAKLVELRFFGGMSIEEAAGCLEISRATASRHWNYARAWLFQRLKKTERARAEE
jgi:RNA polymerase sigma factor (TIGR02999 family)